MPSRGIVLVLLALSCMTAACGGDEGEPLVAGEVTGVYDSNAFSMTVGMATVHMDVPIIGLGDGDLNCDSPNQTDPPSGNSAIIGVPSLDVGVYSGLFVNLYRNIDDFEGVGTNSGSLEITSSGDTVAGIVSFNYIDDEGREFSLEGAFEVTRCE